LATFVRSPVLTKHASKKSTNCGDGSNLTSKHFPLEDIESIFCCNTSFLGASGLREMM
jgi:hypothetical protein